MKVGRSRLTSRLTAGKNSHRREPSGGDAERGNVAVAKPFKAVPRATAEQEFAHIRSALRAALELLDSTYERLSDSTTYVQPMSEGTPESAVAWSDGTSTKIPKDIEEG